MGLSSRAEQQPDLLSGGERQRVAVARAIVHRPALVLADEPTANLDTHNATQLIDLMRDLNRELGLTFIFSTHDQRLLEHTLPHRSPVRRAGGLRQRRQRTQSWRSPCVSFFSSHFATSFAIAAAP